MTIGRWLASVVAVTLAACSSNGSGPCNALVDDGPSIAYSTAPAPAPTPMGGTLAAGSYELSTLIIYTTANVTVPPGTVSAVFQIEGNTMQSVGTANGTVTNYTSTFTISGTTISTVDTCPAPDSGTHGFTATATEFRIYDSNSTTTLEQTYTKR